MSRVHNSSQAAGALRPASSNEPAPAPAATSQLYPSRTNAIQDEQISREHGALLVGDDGIYLRSAGGGEARGREARHGARGEAHKTCLNAPDLLMCVCARARVCKCHCFGRRAHAGGQDQIMNRPKTK